MKFTSYKICKLRSIMSIQEKITIKWKAFRIYKYFDTLDLLLYIIQK